MFLDYEEPWMRMSGQEVFENKNVQKKMMMLFS